MNIQQIFCFNLRWRLRFIWSIFIEFFQICISLLSEAAGIIIYILCHLRIVHTSIDVLIYALSLSRSNFWVQVVRRVLINTWSSSAYWGHEAILITFIMILYSIEFLWSSIRCKKSWLIILISFKIIIVSIIWWFLFFPLVFIGIIVLYLRGWVVHSSDDSSVRRSTDNHSINWRKLFITKSFL